MKNKNYLSALFQSNKPAMNTDPLARIHNNAITLCDKMPIADAALLGTKARQFFSSSTFNGMEKPDSLIPQLDGHYDLYTLLALSVLQALEFGIDLDNANLDLQKPDPYFSLQSFANS